MQAGEIIRYADLDGVGQVSFKEFGKMKQAMAADKGEEFLGSHCEGGRDDVPFEGDQFEEDEVVFVGDDVILGGDLRCDGRCPM